MERSEKGLEFTANPEPEKVRSPLNLAATLAICSGGWFIPGLSHMLLGKWIRGLIFATCVILMFVLANVGVGAPYLLAERMNLGVGTMTATTYDYGTTYLWVAGLLNYLIILDAFDIAQGRKP
jgi:uncharacterized protein DUF6677